MYPHFCDRKTKLLPLADVPYVLRAMGRVPQNWRFMGSYKWGYKSPDMGYTYSYQYVLRAMGRVPQN